MAMYYYFGIESPKSGYLNFIISVRAPSPLFALSLVESLIYSKWAIVPYDFFKAFQLVATHFYTIHVGAHKLSIGAAHPLRPSVFFTKFARRHLSVDKPFSLDE